MPKRRFPSGRDLIYAFIRMYSCGRGGGQPAVLQLHPLAGETGVPPMLFLLLRAAALMHVMDLGLSCLLLSAGLMKEANPIADAVYQSGGLAGLIAFKMFFLIAGVAVIGKAIERRSVLAGFAAAVVFASGAYAVAALMFVAGCWLPVISLA
jgi:hypothetical protein